MNEILKTTIANNFKNTALGFLRIRRNLDIVQFSDTETEVYLKTIISLTPLEDIETTTDIYADLELLLEEDELDFLSELELSEWAYASN